MIAWFLFFGAVLVVMALVSRWIHDWPVSPAIVYLLIGAGFGPAGFALINLSLQEHAAVIEVITEVVVLISLFAVGLKLRVPWRHPSWQVPLRLATFGMIITIVLVALCAWTLLDLPIGACVLLGAILAPTDPVLASDVQTRNSEDRDTVRFSLSAEGGINDGAAFPAVMLGLGLIGLHPIGLAGLEWFTKDVLWAIGVGLLIGWASGRGVVSLVLALRKRGHALEFEEFLVLGLIALTYGLAMTFSAYGFLAVFAAGLAVRTIESEHSAGDSLRESTDRKPAATALTGRILVFTSQLERLAEVGVVLIIGALVTQIHLTPALALFVVVVLVVVRKLAVTAVLIGNTLGRSQQRLLGWFGVRGVGSLYYLSYALERSLPDSLSSLLTDATLATVAASVLVHGVTATPLMERYEAARLRRRSLL